MKPLSERLSDLEQIQVGDITRVYRARDVLLDRFVFVKILQPKFAADAELRGRFLREAKAVARLDHTNLVRIYESGEDPQEGFYMILEWVEGINLSEKFAKQKIFKSREFDSLAKQLLSGLAALHSVGILHRDLKPENVLVKASGEKAGNLSLKDSIYKITDFSLAALSDAPQLTHHQAIIGTPAYMSPEHANGQPLTEASDLFSLGVIFYESATGKNPFLANTLLETLKNIREQEVTLKAGDYAELQEHHRTLLLMLLSKDPKRRPQSAKEALALLDMPPEIIIRRAEPRKKNPRVIPLIVIMIVTVVAIVLFMPQTLTFGPALGDSLQAVDMAARAQKQLYEKADSILNEQIKTEPVKKIITEPKSQTQQLQDDTEKSLKKNATPAKDLAVSLNNAQTNGLDSVELYLTTEPWAHVYFEGKKIGTTPLANPLKLPTGKQSLDLHNPAFPQIEVPINLDDKTEHRQVALADFVALIKVKVKPWGEFYWDGEHIGTTPLSKPFFAAPGKHNLRISHPDMNSVSQDLTTAAGETLSVEVDLTHSKIIFQ